MTLVLLHGSVGVWDEVACLVLPATLIMAVALAVLRQDRAKEQQGADDASATVDRDGESDDEAEVDATTQTAERRSDIA